MNKVKKTSITDRLCNAWRALTNKPAKALTVEIGMQRCDKCEYYKAAHEPASIAQRADGPKYYHEITYLDDLVLVVLYEATDTGPREIARGHGHIIHEGARGITQAAGYALKKIWYRMPK